MTMKFAPRRENGTWTGTVYDHVTDAIRAHHAQYDEVLLPVQSLIEQPDGSWTAAEASPAEVAADITVSRFQARAALLQIGKLEAVDEVVAASGDPVVKLAWAEAVTWVRKSPMIAALAAHPDINLSPGELDELFIVAATIEV